MRQSLRLHPDSLCGAGARIEVEVARPQADRLALSYFLTGKINDIRMPPILASERSDELWRHTCFEAFVRASSGAEYYEFNFAPSTQWAVYRFSSYRSGMCVAAEISAPPIETQSSSDRYTMQVSLDLNRLPELPPKALWRLGLSALIEDTGGRMAYWALVHPPGKPDFHHADCFALELAPVGPP
jgi:hypothetical protein